MAKINVDFSCIHVQNVLLSAGLDASLAKSMGRKLQYRVSASSKKMMKTQNTDIF